MKQTGLKRRRRRRAPDDLTAARAFRAGVLLRDGHRSRVSRATDDLQIHHVVPKSWLKANGHADRVWDTRDGMTVTKREHEKHELAVERIPRRALPLGALEFAREVGAFWMIERYYPAGGPT